LVKNQVKEQVSCILPRIEESMNATLEDEVLTRSSHSSRTSYAIATDLSEMELKKILIEKMEGNKSIQRSDEQRNLYKALVEAYEADKAILDTYGDSTILKRRREDDDQEGPSAGSNRGLTELEYHLEEVYKVTTDQLDWVNPEGQQNPHNLLEPLPLIPDNRVNRESARDVYSKRRIIAVTELQIMEWHDYKHLDWISV
nr:hypothetical protein [Tanacetum cinerariifolium]